MTSGDASAQRALNSFDLMRLIAAFSVLFSHSWALAGSKDPFYDLFQIQIGTAGVFVFFGISGYLITRSWRGDPRTRAFATKRILRIVPGLVVAAMIVAWVLGPLVTHLSLRDYFSDPQTYTYVTRQFLLITFNPELPGVFTDAPVADIVNGSLWTIPLEGCCYILVGIAGVIGVLKRGWLLPLVFVGVLVAMVLGEPRDYPTGNAPDDSMHIVLNALRVGGAFLAGALCALYKDKLPKDYRPWLLLTAILLSIPFPIGVTSALAIIFVPLTAIVFGLRHPGRAGVLTKPGDVSYGFYIYAFPIQQLIVHVEPDVVPVVLLALSLPLAYAAGLASWRLVERPALQLKRVVGPPVVEPSVAAAPAPPGAPAPAEVRPTP